LEYPKTKGRATMRYENDEFYDELYATTSPDEIYGNCNVCRNETELNAFDLCWSCELESAMNPSYSTFDLVAHHMETRMADAEMGDL
jgi:hypothetical protein